LKGHGADVGAGGKGLLAAGDDDAADAVVGVKGQQRGAQLVHQRVVQRVQLLGAVQFDRVSIASSGTSCGSASSQGTKPCA
jgi:hypothetical protein